MPGTKMEFCVTHNSCGTAVCLQDDITSTPFGQICLLILAGMAIHVIYLTMNFVACKLLRLNDPDFKAVLVMASQKTLPISLSVISFLPVETFGAHGLLTIPCIVGHLTQLFMDAFIASKMAAIVEERLEAEALHREDGCSTQASKVRSHAFHLGHVWAPSLLINQTVDGGLQHQSHVELHPLQECSCISPTVLEKLCCWAQQISAKMSDVNTVRSDSTLNTGY